MDILQQTEHFFMNVLPVASPIIIAWLSYKLPKKSKEQTDQIISELSEVKKQIKDVQETAYDSNTKIDEVQEKLKLHDEAHLVTMRMRLDRDIRRAIRRGFTTKDEFYVVENMHKSYKALGGNGYIDHLYNNFEALQIRDDILIEDEKGAQNGL
ncbi:hypothetical protein D8786_08375 [Streptococcus mitis]|uniref:Uncharacterized protein n=1 Tax=Streptococcus mitis TaxID=28037 RepID=A0A428HG82_STRMT|nr:hypothetical protein [Streptococcus mitis]RSJ94804.1 hypothetical protein D8786_08375 [Streptococcus mitis]